MSATMIGVVTAFYVAIALSLWYDGRTGLGLAFAGYALANIGLIIEATK